jgi:hypothetical protein
MFGIGGELILSCVHCGSDKIEIARTMGKTMAQLKKRY